MSLRVFLCVRNSLALQRFENNEVTILRGGDDFKILDVTKTPY